MLKVLFSDVDEFFEEIQKDFARIYRSLVRVTLHRSHHGDSVATSLLATACVDETVVQLRLFLGDCHVYDRSHAEKLWERGLERAAALTNRLKGLDLEVRNGAWQSK